MVNANLKVGMHGDNYIRIVDMIEILREVMDSNDRTIIMKEDIKYIINQLKDASIKK